MSLLDKFSFPHDCVYNIKVEGGMKLSGSATTHVNHDRNVAKVYDESLETLRADHKFVNDWLMEYAQHEEERRRMS